MELALLPKQIDFLNDQSMTACWIGGRGCGKTFAGALWVLNQAMKYPGSRGVVFSSTNPQLKQATIPDFSEVFDSLGVAYHYGEWHGRCEFENGSSFKYQSLDVPADQVKGGNISWLFGDEIDACPEEHVIKLSLATRHPNGSRQKRFIGNSPPPGSWVARWFDPKTAREAGRKVRGPLYQSSMFDNYMLKRDFVAEALLSHPPGTIEYRRYILGEINVPRDGLVYTELDKRHLVKMADVPWDRVIGFVHGLDLGANHFTVFHKIAVTDDDRMYVVREYAARRKLLREHAAAIQEILAWRPAAKLKYEGIEDGEVFSDHDTQDRMELDDLGIDTTPAHKDKLPGIDCVRKRLRQDRLFIVEAECPQWLKEAGNYVWDERKDEPVKKDDDALDSSRYAIASLDLQQDIEIEDQ